MQSCDDELRYWWCNAILSCKKLVKQKLFVCTVLARASPVIRKLYQQEAMFGKDLVPVGSCKPLRKPLDIFALSHIPTWPNYPIFSFSYYFCVLFDTILCWKIHENRIQLIQALRTLYPGLICMKIYDSNIGNCTKLGQKSTVHYTKK